MVHEVGVGLAGADVHGIAREESCDDVLRGLLGEAVALDAETGVSKDGGDEVSTGDGARARGLAGAVKVPLGAEPAAHEFRKRRFKKGAAVLDDGGKIIRGPCYGVALGKSLLLMSEVGAELLIEFGIWLGLVFLFFGEGDMVVIKIQKGGSISPTREGAACEYQKGEDFIKAPFHRLLKFKRRRSDHHSYFIEMVAFLPGWFWPEPWMR